MSKLNQIIAVVTGKKTRVEKEFGDLNKVLQHAELFSGLNRKYDPIDENGEQLPSEEKIAQKNAKDIVGQAVAILTGIMDAVATQEFGNCGAKSDIIVDGNVLAQNVPVTYLLYLEKQMNDLHTFVNNIPVLDPAERWAFDKENAMYKTSEVKTARTKKVQKALVLHPPTQEHPAQTQLITEDVTVGYWAVTKSSNCLSIVDKRNFLEKIIKLQDAVKIAREKANGVDVEDVKIANKLLSFIFG